ncbi:MAG: class I SAM-dependent methyltransferase, partial [Polyangiales bacterium]
MGYSPLSPDAVQTAVLSRVDRKWRTSGNVSVPAIPALLDLYMARFAAMFDALGKGFTDPELADLRALVATRLVDGFRESPHARFHLSWEPQDPPNPGVNYKVWFDTATVQEQYEHWAATRTPPLFGGNADGKVLDLAARYLDPTTAPALDLGAGTGRNSFPLARAGHPTHAVELTAAFVATIRETAAAEALPITALEGDVVRGELDLPADH